MSYGTPPPSDPYAQPAPPPPGTPQGKGFFGALFDFSFEHFVTPMIVKVVYILSIIALGVGWLVFLAAGFSQGAGSGLFVLLLGPDRDHPLPLPDPDDAGVLPRHHPDEPGHPLPPAAALTGA